MDGERQAKNGGANGASSPLEMKVLGYMDQKQAMAKLYASEGVAAGARAAVLATVASAIPTGVAAGARAAVLATVASAIPTLTSVRIFPWARRNLNPTAQALIISSVAGAAYFIVADKTVLASARKNSFKRVQA